MAFPASIGVAILRFHLYDLDVVVRKTVLYAALAVFATVVYLAIVVGVGAWRLVPHDGCGGRRRRDVPARPDPPDTARRPCRVRRGGQHRTVLSEFSERVGGAYSDEDVLPRMVRVLGEGSEPSERTCGSPFRTTSRCRDVAIGGSIREPVRLEDGSVPATAVSTTDSRWSTRELLGVLTVRKPASDPLSADQKLVSDLAAQAGLVLRNVRLTERWARLDDLGPRRSVS